MFMCACMCVCSRCALSWWRAVEINVTLISTSWYLMWVPKLDEPLQSHHWIGTDKPGGMKGKKWGRRGRQHGSRVRIIRKAKHGKEQEKKTKERLNSGIKREKFVMDDSGVPAETLCHAHVSRQQRGISGPWNDQQLDRDPSLSSHKTTPPLCCCGIWMISSLIHSREPN